MSAACDMAAHISLVTEIGREPGDGVDHAAQGQTQVGTRVAIGDRVDVQVVDLLLALFQSRETGSEKGAGLRDGQCLGAIRQPGLPGRRSGGR